MALNTIDIKIKKLHPDAKIPIYGTFHSAGFDIYSIENYDLKPQETYAVHTGIAMEIPEGKCVLIWDRGGMGYRGIHRYSGVIDSDYRGEFKIILHNSTNEIYKIEKGDRIAQGIIQDYYKANFIETQKLQNSERGEAWNHSTGKK